mgnify:CR=1 FL=1
MISIIGAEVNVKKKFATMKISQRKAFSRYHTRRVAPERATPRLGLLVAIAFAAATIFALLSVANWVMK